MLVKTAQRYKKFEPRLIKLKANRFEQNESASSSSCEVQSSFEKKSVGKTSHEFKASNAVCGINHWAKLACHHGTILMLN